MIDSSAIGREFAPTHARVEPGRLRYFFSTLGETNPIYRDPAAAKLAGMAATPIPPTYLFCLEMMDAQNPFEMLEALDIDLRRVLHGEQRFAYLAPVVVGDELTLQIHRHRRHPEKGRRDDPDRRHNQNRQPARRACRGRDPRHRRPQSRGHVMSNSLTSPQVGSVVLDKRFPRITRTTLVRLRRRRRDQGARGRGGCGQRRRHQARLRRELRRSGSGEAWRTRHHRQQRRLHLGLDRPEDD